LVNIRLISMKKTALFILVMASCFWAMGQTIATPKFTSPEVTAMNRFTETPVSYYTGVPAINIPLCEVGINGVSVPISLNYNAGGIRAEQESTWAGLGWSISTGGQITRKIRGVADEMSGFFTNNSISGFLALPGFSQDILTTQRSNFMREAKNGQRDYMPDEFYYEVQGYSGKYMYSQAASKFVVIPKEDLKVSHSGTQLNTHWQIKLSNGAWAAYTHTNKVGNGAQSTITGWLPAYIKNRQGDSIGFEYNSYNYNLLKLPQQSVTFGVGNDGSLNSNLVFTDFTEKLPSRIFTADMEVLFSTHTRTDLPIVGLNDIIVKDKNGNVVKKIIFYHSYFQGNAFDNSTSNTADHRLKRMRLDSIKITGAANGSGAVYRFDYYTETQMPSKYTFAQDHYGFFNGISNASMIPNLEPDRFSSGADRRVKPDKAKLFSLKTITYPTGGRTEYIYESNTARDENIPREMKLQYQDDNFLEKEFNFSTSGPERNSYFPAADSSGGTGIRFFKRYFTIPAGSYPHMGKGWQVQTNIGTTANDISLGLVCNAANVKFTLNKLGPNGSRTFVRSFQVPQDCQNNPPQLRVGSEQKALDIALDIFPGEYEMVVQITYNTNNATNINQPHSTTFKVKWREMNTATKMFYTGGLRVKEIKSYTESSNLALSKKYTYADPANTVNATSGRVVSFPHYRTYLMNRDLNNPPTAYGTRYHANSIIPLETTGGSTTGYTYVAEEQVSPTPGQNLKTVYNFSFLSPLFSDYYKWINIGIYEPKDWTRGKLTAKKVYKGTTVIYEEQNQYYISSPHLPGDVYEDTVREINTDLISTTALNPVMAFPDQDFIDLIDPGAASPYSTFGWWYGLDNYTVNANQILATYQNNGFPGFCCYNPFAVTYQVRLPYFENHTGFDKLKKSTVISSTDNGQSLTTIKDYFYQKTPAHHQLTKTEVYNSKGQLLSSETKYPEAFTGTAIYDNMISRYMIALPVEQINRNETLNKELGRDKTNYALWQGTAFIEPSSVQKSVGGNALETEVTVNSYDIKGNILQTTGKDGIVTAYIWGYNQKYPVARVIGKTHADAVSQSAINTAVINNPADDNAMRIELNKLRNLAGTLVTTYTYKPLTGITSETDERGRSVFYEYDQLNRLLMIKDNEGNIVKKICYNYSGQAENCTLFYNTAQSVSFARNNCGVGYVGSSVTYTVPANTYSSSESQVDANSKAIADANANGQANANTNGICKCAYTGLAAFPVYTSNFPAPGSTITFTLSFYSTNPAGVNWTGVYTQIGSIGGGCKPAATRTITIVDNNSRTWSVQINTLGQFFVKLITGAAPTGTLPINLSGTYSL
jgi:YD repeat-containing protein